MLLPQGGATTWKSARSRFPPSRAVWVFVTRTRFLLCVALFGALLLTWRSIRASAADNLRSRFYCFGPAKSPMDMSTNEYSQWTRNLQTPVLFNHHAPITVNSSTINRIDMNPITSTPTAASNSERVLLLTPLRDASPYLSKYFDLISQLTYPHHLIDLGFLVGDSSDDTLAVLSAELERIQKREDSVSFNSVTIIEKDFGAGEIGTMDVADRHGFKIQAPRRKAMARARNYLLYATMKPEHAWVYWRDADIVESAPEILEDLIAHDKDVIVPNIWFHRYVEQDGKMVDVEGRFDYNSWVETDKGRKLAAKLAKDDILVEGYKEYYDTGRKYMTTEGDYREDKDVEWQLDGIGGVNIVVKADVHKSGINFPCYSFENQAETEGFAKMAKRAKYEVVGLPNYVVWHIDTDEKPR